MYSKTFAKFFLITLHVLVVHIIDETYLQVQVSIPSDWLKESQDYINRELKIQQDLMREHAENLWKISHPEDTGTTTSKPRHDIDVLVVTPSAVTPKITTTEPPPPPPLQSDETNSLDLRSPCLPSKTEVSKKGPDGRWKPRKVCTGSVIFEDNFSRGPGVDNTKWSHEVKMPGRKAYHGFVTYQESLRNCYVKDNTLTIKPSVLDDKTTRIGTRYLENCTGLPDTEECYRTVKSFEILPPIDSALLTTKHIMSFKYGKIEIRAKLPIGDWIVPEIRLEPVSTQTYGEDYSGRIRLAFARGNLRLMQDTKDVGNRHLEMGFEIGHHNPPRLVTYNNDEGWGRAFHNYTLIWTPDNLKFQVDDGTPEPLCFPGHPLYRALGITINGRKKEAIWERASNIAPFDKEFYITLGLSVGGYEHFPDNVRNSGREKPWENHKAKALYNFWENRAQWLGSWENNDGKDSTMVIDYVKITAV